MTMTLRQFLESGGYSLLEKGEYQEFFDALSSIDGTERDWKTFADTFLDNFNLNEVLSKMSGLGGGFGKLICYSSTDSLDIPDSIRKIKYQTFKRCTNLKSVKLPETLVEIEGGAFTGCRSLESIKIPHLIKTIEHNTFQNCSSLKTVDLPKGLRVLESAAFAFCESLESIELPESVEEIDSGVFYGSGLKTIKIDPNNSHFMLNGDGNLVLKRVPTKVVVELS